MSDIDLIYPRTIKKRAIVKDKKKIATPPLLTKEPRKKGSVVKKDKQDVTYGRTDNTGVRTDALLDLLTPPPDKRRPERYAFQFWADQVTRLKKLKQIMNITKDPEDRDEVSLSDMVREAVDDYIAQQIKHIKHSVRSEE